MVSAHRSTLPAKAQTPHPLPSLPRAGRLAPDVRHEVALEEFVHRLEFAQEAGVAAAHQARGGSAARGNCASASCDRPGALRATARFRFARASDCAGCRAARRGRNHFPLPVRGEPAIAKPPRTGRRLRLAPAARGYGARPLRAVTRKRRCREKKKDSRPSSASPLRSQAAACSGRFASTESYRGA